MMRKLPCFSIYKNIPAVLFLMAACASIFIASCTKVPTEAADNAKFIGTWTGSERCVASNYPLDTFLVPSAIENIGPGENDNALNIGVSFGYNNCYYATYLLATTIKYNFTFAVQSFNDKCGVAYTNGGGATLSLGGVLTMSTTVTAGSVTTSCVFSGTKPQ